jgi:hypothetical protein
VGANPAKAKEAKMESRGKRMVPNTFLLVLDTVLPQKLRDRPRSGTRTPASGNFMQPHPYDAQPYFGVTVTRPKKRPEDRIHPAGRFP